MGIVKSDELFRFLQDLKLLPHSHLFRVPKLSMIYLRDRESGKVWGQKVGCGSWLYLNIWQISQSDSKKPLLSRSQCPASSDVHRPVDWRAWRRWYVLWRRPLIQSPPPSGELFQPGSMGASWGTVLGSLNSGKTGIWERKTWPKSSDLKEFTKRIETCCHSHIDWHVLIHQLNQLDTSVSKNLYVQTL